MDKCAQASSRGLWAAGVVVVLACAPLTNCSTTSKPPSDSLSEGDGSGAATQMDAASRDAMSVPPDATTPPPDATMPARDAASALDSGRPQDSSSGDGSCQAGQTFCGGGCVDTKSDPSNCGQCSNTCGSGLTCVGGQCACAVDAGQVLCNNTCVSLPTDPNNCGACGHSCQGSTCANSLCQPTVVAQVAGSPIDDLAVDTANIYWTQIATSQSSGAVSYKPFSGSTTTLSITSSGDSNLNYPRGVAVDAVNMYWVDVGNGAVEAMSLATTQYTQLRPPYFLVDGATNDGPFDIASDGINVYFVTYDGGQVLSEPIGGGTQSILATGEIHPRAIALDAVNVYWVDFGSASATLSSGFVKQAPKSGDGGATIVLAQNEDHPWDIAVDDTSVYWTDHANPGTVKKVPIGGGTVVTLASGQGTPHGIAVDANYVYWTNFTDKNVMRLPKQPGDADAPFVLATNQNTPSTPTAIVVDLKNVYWADPGVQTILKIAK
jgi:hypothetical protein